MVPLARLRHTEMNRLLERAGWPSVGPLDQPCPLRPAAAYLGVSVSTLRRIEADPWALGGHALWRVLRALARLGVLWTADDYYGLSGDRAREAIPIGEPTRESVWEGDPRPLGVSDPLAWPASPPAPSREIGAILADARAASQEIEANAEKGA